MSAMQRNPLPVRLADLLNGSKVESDRLELKAGWNPAAVLRTVCAFANDLHNYGGGYIVLGIADKDGEPVLPPQGVPVKQLDRIQKELLQYCNLIQPPYFPLFGTEVVDGQTVVILWCPGGTTRPYKVPKDVTAKTKDYAYYIRHYANTVIAKNGELKELISLTAIVPFDDRINHHAELDDLKLQLIRAYLREVKSGLYAASSKLDFADLCRQMAIVDGGKEFLKPRNVGLLFFSESPEKFFPYARIEVVHFPQGPAGDRIEERIFSGPLHEQLRGALRHLRNEVIRERIDKVPDRAEAPHTFNYPYRALEEALVNAVYHKGYDVREPIEVRVNPRSIEILSYPGPDPSVKVADLKGERIVSRRYRNRRIGEFLKELELAEGRFTGIPKIRQAMRQNGSPPPRFVTDEGRTFFAVELRIHPSFAAGAEGHDQGHDEGHDRRKAALSETEKRILQALAGGSKSLPEIAGELGYQGRTGHLRNALDKLADDDLIALTLPATPRSKNQKRRLTAKGHKLLGS
jgi:ATP-dependent DNA helicase RecG